MTEVSTVVSTLSVPKKVGTILHRQAPQDACAVIVCIQDLNGNYGVAVNEADIIDHLVTAYGFTHVFVEGASGQGSLELLSQIPKAARAVFFHQLLKQAYLTGAELAGARNVRIDYELMGVDDPDLYRRNHEPAEALELLRSETVAGTAAFRRELDRAFVPLVSQDLYDLIALAGVLRDIVSGEQETGLLFQLAALASSHYVRVPPRIQAAMQRRGAMLSAVRDDDRSTAMDNDWTADVGPFLDDIAKAVADSLPATRRDIDRKVWFLVSTVNLAEKAFRLELLRENAQRFFAFNASDLVVRVSDAVEWLNAHLDTTTAPCSVPLELKELLAQWQLPREFYRMAMERSDRMVVNIDKVIKKNHVQKAIFVSGGFHTGHVIRNLITRYNYAAIVISPEVKELDDSALRKRRLEDLAIFDGRPPARTHVPLRLSLPAAIERAILPYKTRTRAQRRRSDTTFICDVLRLKGDEVLCEIGAGNSDLFALVSHMLTSGFVIAGDRFNLYMGGHFLEFLDPEAVEKKARALGRRDRVELVNVEAGFLNFCDEVFDLIFALSFDDLPRTTDKRKAIGEFLRVLRPSGSIVISDPGLEEVCAQLLLQTRPCIVSRVRSMRFGSGWTVVATKRPIGIYRLDVSACKAEHAHLEEGRVTWVASRRVQD